MNRVIDLPALHVYMYERATNGKYEVQARDLASKLGISAATLYTAIRELTSEGRLIFEHKSSARHPVYQVVDPTQFGTTVRTAPTTKIQNEERGTSQRSRKPAWG